MTATEHVILVDKNDQPLGTAEKLAAHREGLCHRAFSVFVYRKTPQGIEILLQQRALHKYHSPGLWTNTCCSHPRPGEDILQAGQRRLREEMGIDIALKSVGSFHYIAHFDNGLTENEVDHVLIGRMTDTVFQVNAEEVQDYRWINLAELHKEIALLPTKFTPWLNQAFVIAERSLQ
jgi:isopentenyl-diphosphate delta-isomerase type 1